MNKTNRKPFDNNWNVNYKTPRYDALSDPHASFYFNNKSVKKHLFHLKKSIKIQGKFTQKKSMNKLITQRLRYRGNSIAMNKADIYFQLLKSSSSASSIHRSTDSLKTFHKKKKKHKQPISLQEKQLILPNINSERKQEQKSQQKSQQEHKSNHLKFMNFLHQKKTKLRKNLK